MKNKRWLAGPSGWPRIWFVAVAGVPGAGNAIGKWNHVAVLEVVPHRARFQIAFKNDSNAQRRHRPIRTRNGLFGMAIGGADVEFFALPLKRGTEVQLRLIEVTTIDNPKYANLALY